MGIAKRFSIAGLFAGAFAAIAPAARPMAAPSATPATATAAAVAIRDIDGRPQNPLAPARGDINLVLFISAECPVTRRYAPEMDRIVADAAARGVHPFFVFAEPALSVNAARANIKEFHPGTTAPVIIDAALDLANLAGIQVTPEAAIYSGASGRVYRGRIDDLYVSIGQSRRAPTTRDLRDALTAVIGGKPPAHAETEAIGCFIERIIK